MSAAILCIGTELTRGEIQNTNATWLADRLTALGVDVRAIEVVPDETPLIAESLGRLGSEHALIVCTGGLGPTTDDITAASVATLLGVPLVCDAGSLVAITTLVERHGRTMTASNAKQADLPRGASVMPNARGTAPGFSLDIGKARAFFAPGVPGEMYPMFDAHVVPYATAMSREPIHQCRLQVFGAAESALNDQLAGVEETLGVSVGYRAHFPVVEVKLLAKGDLAVGTARERSERAATRVKQLVGDSVVAEGEQTLIDASIEAIRQRGWKLALAESCTGGLVAQLLTRQSVSDFFLGGAVTYANSAKERLVGVSARTLADHGAVSPEVAAAMARGALATFGADIALSITGIAGPTGGSAEKPVGLVHIAVATKDQVVTRELRRVFDRHRIQLWAAYHGFDLLRRTALAT